MPHTDRESHSSNDPCSMSLPRFRDAAYSAAIDLGDLSRRQCTKSTLTRLEISEIMARWTKWPRESLASILAYQIGWIREDGHRIFNPRAASRNSAAIRLALLLTPARQQELETSCHHIVPRPAELYDSYAASVLPTLETKAKFADDGLQTQIDQLLATPWQASVGQRQDRDPRMP